MVAQCFVHLAHPLRIQGNVIEAHLPGTRIGEICEIEKSLLEPEVVGFAQVIGFNKEHTLLSLLNDNNGFSRDNVLLPTGKPFRVAVSERTLGAILDATGTIQGRLDGGPVAAPTGGENLETGGVPRDFTQRKPIAVPLATGVRAIDGLLTC